MPTSATILRVFIASPADVSDERSVVPRVIEDINRLLSPRTRVLLQAVSSDLDTWPGVGRDAQAVINAEIADDYDIFVGIMSVRFGTPTSVAGSGTEEEFLRGYLRFRAFPESMRIMFYFRDSAVRMSELDLEQAGRVQAFKQSLGDKGVYYWEYRDAEEFERLIRLHLGQQVNDYRRTWGMPEAHEQHSDPGATGPIVSDSRAASFGFIEFIEEGNTALASSTAAMNGLNEAVKGLGQSFEDNVREMNAAQSRGPIGTPEIRRLGKRLASDIDEVSEHLRERATEYSRAFAGAIDSLTQALLLLQEDGLTSHPGLSGLMSTIEDYQAMVTTNRQSTLQLRALMETFPRITADLRRAKHMILAALDTIAGEFQSSEKLLGELLDRFKKMGSV